MHIWIPSVRVGTGADIFAERLASGLEKHSLNVTLSWFNQLYEFMPQFLSLNSNQIQADIIHANCNYGFAFSNANAKLVTTLHHNNFDSRARKYKTFVQNIYHDYFVKKFESKSFSVSDKTISVSHSCLKNLDSSLFKTKPAVIYNGVNPDLFKPAQKNINGKKFKLLFVGKPVRGKGFDLLQNIIDNLGEDFYLYYTGYGRSSELDKYSNAENIGKLVQTELVPVYQQCDALLFPSRNEGFGLTVCEAMSCGIPVITSNNSSLPELVSDGETGILCDTDDVDAFANAARTLAENPDTARNMGSAGRQRVLEKFTLDRMVNQYIEVYRELLDTR